MSGRSAQPPNSSPYNPYSPSDGRFSWPLSVIISLTFFVILLAVAITSYVIYVGRTSTNADLLETITIASTAVPPSKKGGGSPLLSATPLAPDVVAAEGELGREDAWQPTTSPLRPKEILYTYQSITTWTATPRPTQVPTSAPTALPTFVSSNSSPANQRPLRIQPGEKWIDVNLSTQTLVAYEGAAPVFDTRVSTGTARHPTVTGQFRIWVRFRSQDMDGRRLGFDYYLKDVPFVQYFYEDYALHGTFWHNNFGHPMSHGCVNLPTPAAEWLYNWADYGTLVNIHG